MTVIIIDGPAVEPVTVEDLKAHLNVTLDGDDALIADKIRRGTHQ